MWALSPASLVAFCWAMTLAVAGWTITNFNQFDLVQMFMQREDLNLSAFSMLGALWLVLSLLVYFTGDIAARIGQRQSREFIVDVDLERAANCTFTLNIILLLTTILWIALTATKVGGIVNLVSLAYLDSLVVRDLLLENKLFTGMRLFYAALPATGCFAAAILAAGRGTLSRRARMLCVITLVLNFVALFILPLVMSQRLLLLQFLLSAYLITCLVRGKVVGLGWLFTAAILFLVTWVLRESITNPTIDRSAMDIGFQKLAFYFVNDLWNGFAPLQAEIPRTFGAVSLQGLMFLTFSDGYFAQELAPQMRQLDAVLGGGDFPFFTAAYVDFGPFLGALFIGGCAFGFQSIYHKSKQSLIWACVYAQLGATLLFSTHGIYFTHQNFLFSIGMIVLIGVLSSQKTMAVRAAPVGLLNA